ncbi:MAG: CCA tRNA nucleotidyltransferase [Sulfitobacter sp.]
MDRTDGMIIPPGTRWLNDPDAQAVCKAVQSGGYDIHFVGGCVRNALLGLPDSDIDLATDAPPETVMKLARAAGLKAVPTGIEHGTVTVVSAGHGFEVTTYRRDVETDGRRAVVAFSGDIVEDARRRDFTMNALYATPDGTVLDPLGGLSDLHAGVVRFIEDADARIQEDYLRILRFFRFSAYYGNPELGFDPQALNAVARNLPGLETLSAERVGAEITKLLAAPDPSRAVATLRQTGVLQVILPGCDDRWLAPVVHAEGVLTLAPDWQLRLAALGGSMVAERLRLSKANARVVEDISTASYGAMSLAEVAYRMGDRVARGALILRSVMANAPPDPDLLTGIAAASAARFPVTASDLMPEYGGPALGLRLKFLERAWIASEFGLDREALMALPAD